MAAVFREPDEPACGAVVLLVSHGETLCVIEADCEALGCAREAGAERLHIGFLGTPELGEGQRPGRGWQTLQPEPLVRMQHSEGWLAGSGDLLDIDADRQMRQRDCDKAGARRQRQVQSRAVWSEDQRPARGLMPDLDSILP